VAQRGDLFTGFATLNAMTETPKNTLNWGMLCHLAGLTTYLGIPFGNILAPLIIWLVKKDDDAVVMTEGRESINFNISFTIYGLLAGLLCYVLIGFAFLPVILVVHVVLIVKAVLRANKGEPVRYPFTLRIIQ
jgi:uncharacterized Tic20 family protein